MAGDVANIKAGIRLKLRNGLTVRSHTICHYSYNLPLCFILKTSRINSTFGFLRTQQPTVKPKELFFPTLEKIE